MNSRLTTAQAWRHVSSRDRWMQVAFCLAFAVFIGCDRDPMIRVYDVPKDPPKVSRTPPRMAKAEGPTRFLIAVVPRGDRVIFVKASDRPDRLEGIGAGLRQIAATLQRESGKLTWKLPDGWIEKPGNEVTAAIIQSSEKEGSVKITVTELGGPDSADAWDQYLEDNINRWRGQLGLARNTFDDQKKSLEKIDGKDGEAATWLVDLQSEPAPSNDAEPQSEPAPSVTNDSKPKSFDPSELKYKTPDGWKGEGPSGLRAASFVIEEAGSQGQVTVVPASGDRLSNVKRWQGQLMTDGPAEKIDALAEKVIANALPVKTSHGIEGFLYTLSQSDDADAPSMLAAILPIPDSNFSLFVKLTGDAKLAQNHRDRLIQFISSMEW